MREDITTKNNGSDSTDLRERPELPSDVEENEDDAIGMIGPGRSFPGNRNMQTLQPQADPMMPLVYFTAGAASALLAFLVFYLCLRKLPRKEYCCQHKEEKLAKKED